MGAYFDRVGTGRYRPTVHAQGAWNEAEIHFSPLGGLLVHEIDLHRAGADPADTKQLSRVSFDILGFLAAEEITIEVTTTRPGRTIELVEARASIRGRTAVVARAWFIGAVDTTAVEGGAPSDIAAPSTTRPWSMAGTWSGGYIDSLQVRPVGKPTAGRTTAWITTEVVLVEAREVTPHARFVALVDTANGIAVREHPGEWLFPNLDLTIHLFRQPAGPWVGLDTTVAFGPTGLGLTSSVLHDESGPVGRAEQTLTVRPAR